MDTESARETIERNYRPKQTGTEPKGDRKMSRREEVEKQLADIDFANSDYEGNWYAVRPLARTLADEVDAERAIVTKLLDMLEPGVAPPKSHQSCSCVDCRQHEINEGRYNRALEIAGRKE